jgi:hypothetical protein
MNAVMYRFTLQPFVFEMRPDCYEACVLCNICEGGVEENIWT